MTQSKGFTLTEVIIGITILSLALISITTLTLSSIRANQANIDRMTAYYLAQEGLEGLRNIRDSNWLQNYTWNEGGTAFWGSGFATEGVYRIDYRPWADSSELNAMPWVLDYLGPDEASINPDDAQLYKADGSTASVYFYLHDTSSGSLDYDESRYRRYLVVTYPDPDEAALEVTAVIQWEDRGRERQLEVSTLLSDWREGPI